MGQGWHGRAENASKDPLKGRRRDVVCNLCDVHDLAVQLYVYGNGEDEWEKKQQKTEDKRSRKKTNSVKLGI